MSRSFPPGFRWGTATSSYQIEGAVQLDGRGPSIWDTFTRVPGAIADGTTGDVACDHYHRYRDDVRLMSELGIQDYRFSVAWPRVQPTGRGAPHPTGLGFYSRLVDELLAHGIRPLVTLYHWDLPQALQDEGGWPDRDTAHRFAEYVRLVAEHLGDRVLAFTTLNEPWCAAFLGYGSGAHAPGIRDDQAAFTAAHHLLLGHGLAVQALRATLPGDRQVSVTVNPVNTTPATATPADQRAARDAELTQNHVFLDPLLRGELNAELVSRTTPRIDWGFVRDDDLAVISSPIDFLGVNYYNPHTVSARRLDGASAWPGVHDAWIVPEPSPVTGMGWPVRPHTFTELLLRLHRDYPSTPMVVTENGAAFGDVVSPDGTVDDRDRTAYLQSHVTAVLEAIEAGADIRGYFAWSLLDNFEWAWGLAQRFGIVHVDFDTQRRTPKTSALAYREIIREHGSRSGC